MTRTMQHPIRCDMLRNISAYNFPKGSAKSTKHLSDLELVNNTHPLDRKRFVNQLLKAGRITKKEALKYNVRLTFNDYYDYD